MKVTLIQCIPSECGTDASLQSFDELIGTGTGADMYIFPEMFASGQIIDPTGPAQEMNGSTVAWMRRKAASLDAAVAGSLAVMENGRYYNRMCMAKPDGSVVLYDKRHLFSYSGENLHYTPGNERVVTEFRGVRILLQICYDLRFPIFCRNMDDYDMIVYVANWPVKRQTSWDVLLRARAMENQCFVAGVNRTGDDMFGHYDGHTVLISPYGEVLASASDNTVEMVTCDIDMEHLHHFREKFPVMNDADSFTLTDINYKNT